MASQFDVLNSINQNGIYGVDESILPNGFYQSNKNNLIKIVMENGRTNYVLRKNFQFQDNYKDLVNTYLHHSIKPLFYYLLLLVFAMKKLHQIKIKYDLIQKLYFFMDITTLKSLQSPFNKANCVYKKIVVNGKLVKKNYDELVDYIYNETIDKDIWELGITVDPQYNIIGHSSDDEYSSFFDDGGEAY